MKRVFVYEHLSALGGSDPGVPGSLPPSLWREGRAMLDAISADFRSIPSVEVETVDSGAEAAFRRCAARADFSLVIAPEFDGILEKRCEWVEQSNGRLLGPSSAAVRLTADKLELHHRFQRHGIPTPPTWPLGEEPRHFPMVWKPRYGAGSQATFLVKSSDELSMLENELRSARTDAEMIVQEYVDGFAASVAFLIGPQERVAMQPCSQLLSSEGRFQYRGGRTPLEPDLACRAVSLATRALDVIPGLCGYVGVDLILGSDAHSDCIVEVNPRLTTSYVGLRRAAGFNIAEMMLKAVRGEPVPKLCWHPKQVDFTPECATVIDIG